MTFALLYHLIVIVYSIFIIHLFILTFNSLQSERIGPGDGKEKEEEKSGRQLTKGERKTNRGEERERERKKTLKSS